MSMVTPMQGTPVVPGVAYGPALVAVTSIAAEALERYRSAGHADADAALADYDAAAAEVAEGFRRKAEAAGGAAAQVLTASAGLASDRGLRGAVEKNVKDGQDLVAAVDAAVEQFAELFTSMGGLMAERVTDLRDINGRIAARLVGEPEPGAPAPDHAAVIVAADLAPADTAGLDPELVLALITEKGGPTSHTAIIARQLGIPCVVGAAGVLDISDGASVLVDGGTGIIELDPDAEAAEEAVEHDRAQRAAQAAWSGRGSTSDGHEVGLLANVADAVTAQSAAEEPVSGIGLFRTELCFLDQQDEPTIEEQVEVYASVLTEFSGRGYVVVRTLDAGSDKPISFASRDGEENPALGVRGLRLSFDDPGLLHRQLDAVAAAAEKTGTQTWVMAPMVATVAEARDFAAAVRERGLKPGVMVEVPSAALLADRLLEEVDFLSIGTNDLTQYTMAADRMSSELAHLTDPWQPALLHMVSITASAGQRAGKPVGVCGEAAADPYLACVLVGLGVTSLSMSVRSVRAVGARLEGVSHEQCRAMAQAALAASSPESAREAVRDVLDA